MKTLVVLAAGMGSRFGGLKQIEPVGPNGEFIIDYSVYDAYQAGFEKVVFVIKEENLEIFKETIGKRIANKVKVEYAFQSLDILPEEVREKREKQLGTGHAVYCAKDFVEGPFAVISADDYYGAGAFSELAKYLDSENGAFVVGYKLQDTIISDEEVKRGVIIERDGVVDALRESICKKMDDHILCTDLTTNEEYKMPLDGRVSMLFFGFNNNFFDRCESMFNEFLKCEDILTKEFFMPDVFNSFIDDGEAKMIKTSEKWMGMTYREDLVIVQKTIEALIGEGKYPNKLWEE